jgi:predicted GNAT family acetyltransferase
MTHIDDTVTVTRNDEASRYEIHVGDVLGGYTQFMIDAKGRHVFPETVIDPAFRGRGLANILVAEAMKDAAARGDVVEPICPVVRRWLRHNKVEGLKVVWPIWADREPDEESP